MARVVEQEQIPVEDEEVFVDLGHPSGIDPCCWAAFTDPRIKGWFFNDWNEVMIEAESDDENPCEWLREFLWRMTVILRQMGEDPTEKSKTPEEGEKDAQTIEAVLADWDACSAKSWSGDFQASGDSFSDAWAVVKMPLVRDSIEYLEPDWKGFPTTVASFQHPTNPDVQYRMRAWVDQGGTRMAVDDLTGEEGRRAGFAYFRTPYDKGDSITTSDINTKPDYRRLGIATAMYDLINEMGQKYDEDTRVMSHPANLSEANTQLWDRALRLSRGFGIEDKPIHRKNIFWPKKGVYR
jgi:ribosomal protein S18 acetylase RimI-like enzyme